MKKIVKKILGKKNTSKIKNYIKYFKYYSKILGKDIFFLNNKIVKKYNVYYQNKKNIFCGYYDLNPILNNKLLVHVVDKNASPQKDLAEIGYYDLCTNKYHKITDSKAWCWQQGSRLRWSNIENNTIYFNDYINNRYCFKKYNINKNKIIKVISYPLYDIDKNEKYGVSINFLRLQRLRPGYGYSNTTDETKQEKAPKNDGLFLVDLEKNTKIMLVSLYELAKLTDLNEEYEHYINHISFSPNGKKVMFFHIWNEKSDFDWKTQLCVIDINGKNLKILEKNDIVSHYCWQDDETLLITGVDIKNKVEFYRYYKLKNNDIIGLEDNKLKRDGHPTIWENKQYFCSDTYPNSKCMQTLFLYNVKKRKYVNICELFSHPMLEGEKRCDLHPKLDLKDNKIIVDTTYRKKSRSVMVVELKDIDKNGKKE